MDEIDRGGFQVSGTGRKERRTGRNRVEPVNLLREDLNQNCTDKRHVVSEKRRRLGRTTSFFADGRTTRRLRQNDKSFMANDSRTDCLQPLWRVGARGRAWGRVVTFRWRV